MQNDTLGLIRVKGFLDENNQFIDKTFFFSSNTRKKCFQF